VSRGARGSGPRVLVVTAAPDRRPSTELLREVVEELRRRPGAVVEVWFLRGDPDPGRWPDARNVDRLRTWVVPDTLERVGLAAAAHALRGARLRWWWRRVAPAAVVLDDGLGARVMPRGASVIVIGRRNPVPPQGAALEPDPIESPDLVLSTAERAGDPAHGPRHLRGPVIAQSARAVAAGASERATRTREQHRLPIDRQLLVGWGDHAWIDGLDIFVRTLWQVRRDLREEVHGVWFGDLHPADAERIRFDAVRCGIADALHLRPAGDLESRCCGDAVVLPYRSRVDDADLLAPIATGIGVVTFPWCDVDDPAVEVVPWLDADAAARSVASILTEGRSGRTDPAIDRHDVGRRVDDLLRAVAELVG
jgi:hypothetical protein